jgi:hypothetical protein
MQAQKGVCVSTELQPKPLFRLQAYLVETKKVIKLLTEVCVEFKNLLVILTLIVFFILGVLRALGH